MNLSGEASENRHGGRTQKASGWLPWILLVVGCLTFGGITGLFLAVAQRPPILVLEEFDEARKRWDETRVPNYRIEIVVEGAQPATYTVEVRDGVAINANRNGNPLTQSRTFATWSVDGMFGTMESDVVNLETQTKKSKDGGGSPTLMLRAEFDRHYGYPKRYFRADWQRNLETSWTVTRFEELSSTR